MPFSNQSRFAILGLAMVGLLASDEKLATRKHLPCGKTLSVTNLLTFMNDKDWILVDTRATGAYNGWALDGINRGGHIPHAVDFPASWLNINHKEKTERLATALRTKGIERTKHVVLYSTNELDRNRVASYLRETGFRQIYCFDFKDWTEDEGRPLVRYKNFHLLVPASVVKLLLDGRLPETFGDATRMKFVEVSWGDEDASYSKGHVPRSFHVNTDHFEPPPQWKLGNRDVLTQFAARYGFQTDDTAIISGENPTACYRLAIVLRYMGVHDVRVLNGGFAAWRNAKYPIETKKSSPPKAMSFGAPIPGRPTLFDSIEQVKAGLGKPNEFGSCAQAGVRGVDYFHESG